jgi:hypothetical protein
VPVSFAGAQMPEVFAHFAVEAHQCSLKIFNLANAC